MSKKDIKHVGTQASSHDPPRAPEPALQPNRRRIWLFRIVTAILSPILLFAVVELGLRIAGIGYPTAYFLPIENQPAYYGNPKFGWRFFPPAIARMPPAFKLPKEKAPGTYRIFVLGSSAALGFPDPSFSFARILEAMLRNQFPNAKFEVINTAMVAVNSHVLVPIARDCAGMSPDLMIVYEGNNEVIGPFGPATVFAGFTPRRAMIDAELFLKRMRIGQLMTGLVQSVRDENFAAEWKGMEFFLQNQLAANDPRLATVYSNFESNLHAICDAGRDCGARIFLCTVGVNLADCPPFVSLHNPSLSEAARSQWESTYSTAKALETKQDHTAALAEYEKTAAMDDDFAELWFRKARCLTALGRSQEAAIAFQKARDLDALRFRADSRLNEIVRSTAVDEITALIDVEKDLNTAADGGSHVPGNDYFLEHVHLNFAGNYAIARSVFTKLVPLLPDSIRFSAKLINTPSRPQCEELLAYSDWDRYQILKDVVALVERPPFNQQLDHEPRLSSLRDAMRSSSGTAEKILSAISLCNNALVTMPNDPHIQRKLAKLLELTGNPQGAHTALVSVKEDLPFFADPQIELAGLETRMGMYKQAMDTSRITIELSTCDRLCQSQAKYNMGVIFEKQNQSDEAMAAYQEAISLRPSYVEAYGNLGLLHASRGELEKAAEYDRKAIELAPHEYRTHLNFSLLLIKQSKRDEAINEFQEVLRLRPSEMMAYVMIADALIRMEAWDAALSATRQAVELNPQAAEAYYLLGTVEMNRGLLSEAIDHFAKALELRPSFEDARRKMELSRNLQIQRATGANSTG